MNQDDLFFEIPELEYDQEGLSSITVDPRYRRFWFNWHLEIVRNEDGTEKHRWTTTDGDHPGGLRTIDFGNLRRRWLNEGEDDGVLDLIRHPVLVGILSRLNPELGLTVDKFHINVFAAGQTYPAHVDGGRRAAIMLPLDGSESQIEFHLPNGKIRHAYRHATVLNVKEMHWPVPRSDGYRMMGAIAIEDTSYGRCLELHRSGNFVI